MRLWYRRELLTHFVLPAVLWRHFWNQHPVGSTGQGTHQSQVAEEETDKSIITNTSNADNHLCVKTVLTHNACPSPLAQRFAGDWGTSEDGKGESSTSKHHNTAPFSNLTHLCAVVMMASTTSMILCRAESVPMVMSVPQKSLSIEPTMPTMWRAEYFWMESCSIRPRKNQGLGVKPVHPVSPWVISTVIKDYSAKRWQNTTRGGDESSTWALRAFQISMEFTFVCVQIKQSQCGKPDTARSHTTLLHQLGQQPAPLLPEEVGSGQAAVSADHAQICDAALHQVVSCLQTALVGAKLFTAGAADHSSTLRVTRAGFRLGFFELKQKPADAQLRASDVLLTTCSMLETLSHVASLMLSPPSTIPWYPWMIFFFFMHN